MFTDSSFGNTADLSSQIGYIVLLVDSTGRANILHYGSKRCRRVTRSVMAAELLSLVTGFDQAYTVRHIMEEILGRKLDLDAYVDSRTTFNCVAKSASTLEKRLQIDVASLREAYTRGEIKNFGWVPGSMNPADGLTKRVILADKHPLIRLMIENKIDINPKGWSMRKD